MEEIVSGVFRGGPGAYNWYALREDDEITLIDAGCPKDWPRIVAGLEMIGSSIEAVSGMIITHVHSDHFGGAKAAAVDGVDVAVHLDDQARALGQYEGKFSAEASDLPLFSFRTLKNFLPMMLAGVLKLEFLDRVGTFRGGQTLDLPGRPTAIHTPGHTEGHTMFHSDDRLFTGDGLVTMDLLGSSLGPQPMPPVFDVDTEQARDSWDLIINIDADLILPGHGGPWRGSPAHAVMMARSR